MAASDISGPDLGDQASAAQILNDDPALLGLDYTQLLAANLVKMELKKDGKPSFQWHADDKQWISAFTNQSVCFLHGNSGVKFDRFDSVRD